jgi:hypothetical protein
LQEKKDIDANKDAPTWLVDEEFIGEQDGKRFVPDKVARTPDGVTEAERVLLAREADRAARWQGFEQAFQFGPFLAGGQERFEFIGVVEVVFDDVLAASSDEDELVDAGGLCFLDGVLDDWLVDDWQHFLGNGLCCGQEPRAHACHGEHSFPDRSGSF